MEITDTSNAESYEYKGETYYFRTTLCKIQFEQNPEKYINKENMDDHTKHQH
ncbi:YHS domain protein [bacterium BMS3Abin04]|nr:YHS domain protein [bacterium BMS3Abin04]